MDIFPGCGGKGTNLATEVDSKISDRQNKKRLEVPDAPELRRPDFHRLILFRYTAASSKIIAVAHFNRYLQLLFLMSWIKQ